MKKIFILVSLIALIVWGLISVVFASTPATRQYDFEDDKLNGIPITASRMDAEFDNDITKLNQKVIIQSTTPSSPIAGMLWYDSSNKLLKQYRNSEWVGMPLHIGTAAPTTMQEGDIWYDTTNDVLKMSDGGVFATIASSTATGGNVGIGTFIANAKLQVRSAANKNIIIGSNVLLSDGAAVSSVNDANGANLGLEMRGSTVQISALGANPIQFYTNGSQRAVITSAGNVGIGSTIPNQKLTVAGTVYSTSGGFQFPDNTTQATATTDITAVDSTQVFNNQFTAANTFQDLDVSSVTGVRKSIVILGVRTDASITVSVRTNGHTGTGAGVAAGTNTNGAGILVAVTDSSGIIECAGSNNTATVNIRVIGYH